MCGLAGVASAGSPADWPSVLQSMGDTLSHRGPDDHGLWFDADAGIGLVHRRLSIIDLSPAGHQPMASTSGRYVIAFNGEIYNHRALRGELEGTGTVFRGHSDTEVLLAAIEAWGIPETLKRANGMFALALWDRRERALSLARDRMGEKPLYYGWHGNTFLFTSELKAMRAHPGFRPEVDRQALALYLQFNYVPTPFSIYAGIRKLVPGTWLTVSPNRPGKVEGPYTYWSVDEAVGHGEGNRFSGSRREAVDALDRVLREAVALRMEADVPLGAFLSGGIDSSMVVALMQAQSTQRIRTFSIGFSDGAYNEAAYAKAVAEHLGTEHTELYLHANDALDVIPQLPELYDEPMGDSSQAPTHLVARLARSAVTVALSGDGGDELFGGYNRYFMGRRFWQRFGRVPAPVRRMGGACLSAVLTPGVCSGLAGIGRRLSGTRPRTATLCDKAEKLRYLLGAKDADAMYGELVSFWRNPARMLQQDVHIPTVLQDAGASLPQGLSMAERMMAMDMKTYLLDDILAKVDRATMGVSLEGRIPFLDPHVVEFASSLPEEYKLGSTSGKLLLRDLLDRYAPRTLMERPKMGFSMPIASWLRRDLRPWGEALLDEQRLKEEGIFDPGQVRQAWNDHVGGRSNLQYKLWNILMFQAWNETWMK